MEFLALLLVVILWAPAFDSGEGPNACYAVNARMEQINGPCTPEMTRGRTR